MLSLILAHLVCICPTQMMAVMNNVGFVLTFFLSQYSNFILEIHLFYFSSIDPNTCSSACMENFPWNDLKAQARMKIIYKWLLWTWPRYQVTLQFLMLSSNEAPKRIEFRFSALNTHSAGGDSVVNTGSCANQAPRFRCLICWHCCLIQLDLWTSSSWGKSVDIPSDSYFQHWTITK